MTSSITSDALIYTISIPDTPDPSMTDEIIESQATKVKATYGVEPGRMTRAIGLYRKGAIRKLGDVRTTQTWHASSDKDPHGYTVNELSMTCTCKDWQNHNATGQESTFCCKHLVAVLLFRHIQTELARREEIAKTKAPDSLEDIFSVLFDKPLPSKRAELEAKKAEEIA